MRNSKIAVKIFFAIILFIVAIFGLRAFYMSFPFLREPSSSFLIRKEVLSDEETAEALVVREEKIITDNSDRPINKERLEGEKVISGEKIFRYYSEKENRKLEEIDKINKEIEEYLITKGDNYSSKENPAIDAKIDKLIANLSNMNSQAYIRKIEKEISEDILEKAKQSGNLNKDGSKLRDLTSKKEKLLRELNDNTREINSPFAGVVSYKVDRL